MVETDADGVPVDLDRPALRAFLRYAASDPRRALRGPVAEEVDRIETRDRGLRRRRETQVGDETVERVPARRGARPAPGLAGPCRAPGRRTLRPMRDPGHVAVGTWSGGRFMHFGEAIDDERLEALLRPGDGIDTVLTADTYGQGEADLLLGRALDGRRPRGLLRRRRRGPRLLRGRARRPARLPALHRPAPARPRGLRATTCAWPPSARSSAAACDVLRPAAAPQPRPHRLHQRRGLGGDGRAARRRAWRARSAWRPARRTASRST